MDENLLGTGLFCHVLGSPEDLQENSYYCSWPQSRLDAYICTTAKQKARSRFQKRIAGSIQFLTFLMSKNWFFLPFLKPQSFLHFLELFQSVGIHVGVRCQEHILEANMVGLRKDREMLFHTSAPPQHLSPFSRLLFPPKVPHVLGILIKAYSRDGKYMTRVPLLIACCAYGRQNSK